MIKSMAGGLFAVFSMLLIVLLGQKAWLRIKSGGAKFDVAG
jgi:hypothetical protein